MFEKKRSLVYIGVVLVKDRETRQKASLWVKWNQNQGSQFASQVAFNNVCGIELGCVDQWRRLHFIGERNTKKESAENERGLLCRHRVSPAWLIDSDLFPPTGRKITVYLDRTWIFQRERLIFLCKLSLVVLGGYASRGDLSSSRHRTRTPSLRKASETKNKVEPYFKVRTQKMG